jgi:F-type H+-transporting ATPase subunit epsilon
MNLVILSPDQEIFAGAVKSVTVPGTNGGFEMLKNHAPIVSSLGKGEVKVVTETGEKLSFIIDGGFVEQLNNQVALLVSGVSAS